MILFFVAFVVLVGLMVGSLLILALIIRLYRGGYLSWMRPGRKTSAKASGSRIDDMVADLTEEIRKVDDDEAKAADRRKAIVAIREALKKDSSVILPK